MVQKSICPCALNLMAAKILFGFAGFHPIGYSSGQKDCSKQQDWISPQAPKLFSWKFNQ